MSRVQEATDRMYALFSPKATRVCILESALARIAKYPSTPHQELSLSHMRQIAREALANTEHRKKAAP